MSWPSMLLIEKHYPWHNSPGGLKKKKRDFRDKTGTAPWVAHRYLAHGSRTLRNWRAASVTDFSIGKRSADEPPT
jgi:hypothetical protein